MSDNPRSDRAKNRNISLGLRHKYIKKKAQIFALLKKIRTFAFENSVYEYTFRFAMHSKKDKTGLITFRGGPFSFFMSLNVLYACKNE